MNINAVNQAAIGKMIKKNKSPTQAVRTADDRISVSGELKEKMLVRKYLGGCKILSHSLM